MRVRRPGECLEYGVAIPHESFRSKRVRYQDAAEICFLKLQRELSLGGEDSMPAFHDLQVTDAELDEYRESHAKKPPLRRAPPATEPRLLGEGVEKGHSS